VQQVHLPPLTKVNKYLLIMLCASFILNSVLINIVKMPAANFLGLSLAGIQSGMVFQFITYPLANVGLMEVVFSGILFWFLGSDLEQIWGQRKYIAYLLFTTLLSGVIYILLSVVVGGAIAGYPFHGMAAFSSAMCVSYAVIFPDRVFQFFMLIPIKAKYFCMILAAMALWQGIFTPGGAQAWGQVAAMVFGFFFVRYHNLPIFSKLIGFGSTNKASKSKRSKNKANLRIVKNDDDDQPKYWH